jgi:hypothetical protein
VTVVSLVLLASLNHTATLSADALTQSQTPTEVFTAYRAALAKATSFNELLPFMDAKSRGMIEVLPEAQRAGMFELMKKFASTYSDVAVTGEKITGDAAVLSLSGKDPKGQPATGTVPMTKEASGWKVGTEKWSSKPR